MQDLGGVAYFEYRTRRGPVRLVPRGERWIILFEDENLGSYHSPRAAASDASGGTTFMPSSGVDLGELDIPEDLPEWTCIRRQRP